MNWKRNIAIAIVFLTLICVCVYVYATNEKVSNSKVKFFSDLDISAKTTIANVEKSKNMTINNEQLNLEYKETKLDKDIYTSEASDEYIFDDEKLVGFIKKADLIKYKSYSIEMNLDKAKEIADSFGKENISNFDLYQMVYSDYIESYKEYTIIYMHKLNGLDTQDTVKINVNDMGEILSFSAFNQGKFEKYKDIEIDIENINKVQLEAIGNKYKENLKNTEIQQQFLNIVDGKLLLQTDILVTFNSDNAQELVNGETLIYEIN